MNKTKVTYMDADSLIPYANNPRLNDNAVDAVAASIKEFGFKVPIVVDGENVIINGHTRLKAAHKLGLKQVPVIVADDLTPEQVKAFRLADNKTSEFAEWDMDKLDIELEGIPDIDMGEFGFDIEIDDMEEGTEVKEDEVPEVKDVEPKAKRGDIYQLGRHRLMCGDSTNQEDVDKLMNGVKADMVFTDPPYGMNLDTDYRGMINNLDFAKEKNFTGGKKYRQGIVDDFKPQMIDAVLNMNAKETFVWGANYFAELIPNRNYGSWVVWDKRSNNNDDIDADYSSDKMYGSCFELCWSKNKHKQDIARIKWAGVFGKEQEFDHKRYHPTQKPIKLVTWFLDRYSKKNENICDLFGGSGSTLIACEQLNRKCYMMELDPHYVDVIIERWENFTGQKAKLLNEV